MSPTEVVVDLVLGLFAATYGTLIGAGGGFIMAPVLLLAFDKPQHVAAATSLTAVIFNAVTAIFSYHQQRRIDYYTGLRFALATIPGAVVGSLIGPSIPAPVFRIFFGVVLVLVAGYMTVRGERPVGRAPDVVVDETFLRAQGKVVRVLIDSTGKQHVFGYRLRDGLLLSGAIGVLSSLLGVGGGIIHTPVMIAVFGVPAHIAVATSQFILLISAATGAASYLVQGAVEIPTAVALGLGGIAGARCGAAIARRVRGKWIVHALAIALVLVGIRLIWSGLVV